MIRIERTAAPEFFSSPLCTGIQADLKEFYAEFTSAKRRSTFDWEKPLVYLRQYSRPELNRMFAGKCAYCEQDGSGTKGGELAIAHYRPYRGARAIDPKTSETIYHENHYWWLAFEWDNVLLLCPECDRFKSTWFPLEDESQRTRASGNTEPSQATERPMLLDPCGDDPELHLRFFEDGRIDGTSERGYMTIEMLNLNRDDLVQGRRRAMERALAEYETFEASLPDPPPDVTLNIANVMSQRSELPFLGIQRQFVNERLQQNASARAVLEAVLDAKEMWRSAAAEGIFESAGAEPPDALPPPPVTAAPLDLGRIAIERIHLHNFRNIEDLELEVPLTTGDGRTPWLVFLGENGVGKSSILQALVLTLMGDEHRSEVRGITADRVLRHFRGDDGSVQQADEGWVRIWIAGQSAPLELSFKRGDPAFYSTVPAPRTYLLAYGSTRLLPDDDLAPYESPGRVRVRNLFRPSAPLVDATRWLLDLHGEDEERFDFMMRGLRRILLLKDHETIEPDLDADAPRILIEFNHELTTLDSLSDGYRTMLALAVDIMSMLSREGTSMEEAEGVLVIDEIGTNLHPGWKKRVVERFREVFPRLQVIATTHEPLCLRGLYEGETVLLRRDFDEKVAAITNLPNPNDLRVDELLASEFFGLNSTVESDLEEVYAEYYRLLTMPQLNAADRARRDELKGQLREREHLGHGLRDELMYEVIDKLLAEQLRSRTPLRRPELKKEALERVLQSWKDAGVYGTSESP